MLVGRATVFLVGLSLILALVLGAATTALGATGGNFLLGKLNAATTPTSLVGTLADAAKSAFVVQNKSGGPALDLRVGNATTPANDVAPMKVNSSKKVAKLNADRIDNREANSFANGVGGVATNADKLDGKDSTDFAPAYERTVVVGPVGTPTENGTALKDALSGITGASETDPYLLYVEPGTYDLGNGSLTMKEYVDIEGAGELRTLITGGVSTSEYDCRAGTVLGASNAELRFLTVQNRMRNDVVAGCNVGIYNNAASPRLTHVTVDLSRGTPARESRGIYNYPSASPTMTDVTITVSQGSNDHGVYSESGSSATASSPTIRHSTISVENDSGGGDYAILQLGGTAKVSFSQLVGPAAGSSGALRCFSNHDENMAAKSCS